MRTKLLAFFTAAFMAVFCCLAPPAMATGGTDCSGTVGTSSVEFVSANGLRRYALIQNVGAVNLGVNLNAGTAEIGTAGTFTLVPNGSLEIQGSNGVLLPGAITGICASGTCQITCKEVP